MKPKWIFLCARICLIVAAAVSYPARAQLLDSACHQNTFPSGFIPFALDDAGTIALGTGDGAGNLFRYEIASGTLTQLTNDPQVVGANGITLPNHLVAASADGRYVLGSPGWDASVDQNTGQQTFYGGGPAFVIDTMDGQRTTISALTAGQFVDAANMSRDGNYVFLLEGSVAAASSPSGFSRISRQQPSDVRDIGAEVVAAVGNGFTLQDLFGAFFALSQAGDVMPISDDGNVALFSTGHDLLGSAPTSSVRQTQPAGAAPVNSLAYRYDLTNHQLSYIAHVDLASSKARVSTAFILALHPTGTDGLLTASSRFLPIVGLPNSGGGQQLYVSDAATGQTIQVTNMPLGPHGDPFSTADFPYMTPNENAVLFESDEDFVGSNPSGTYQIFRYDVGGGAITQVTDYYDPLAALMQSLGIANLNFTLNNEFLAETLVNWSNSDGTVLILSTVASGGSASSDTSSGGGVSVTGGIPTAAVNSGSPPDTFKFEVWNCR